MGVHLFMASVVQLQEVLLPRLSATDLLRLGLSCKALLAWVLSTPPAYWQVSSVFHCNERSCTLNSADTSLVLAELLALKAFLPSADPDIHSSLTFT